jgi:hypothetical protein
MRSVVERARQHRKGVSAAIVTGGFPFHSPYPARVVFGRLCVFQKRRPARRPLPADCRAAEQGRGQCKDRDSSGYVAKGKRGSWAGRGQRGEPCVCLSSPQSFARGPRQAECLLVAERGVEAHHRLLLLRGEGAVLQARPEVVDPPQPAALAVPLEPCRRRTEFLSF